MGTKPTTDPGAGVAALAAIVGAEHVVADEAGLELVSRTAIPQRFIPDVAVYPQSAPEVRQILRLANELCWPVWPVSRGKNWGYGSKSACYPGGITLILERMDKIHEVNEELGYAVVEPGVTYEQLNDHLKSKNYRLWADSTGSTKSGSVIGNALDKGRGVTPYADHFGCLCGMEVVLPDGRTIATGGGPENAYHAWNTYKWGVGPYLDGLFAQSNFGVVTKAGVWLMPAPEHYDFFIFEYAAAPSRFGDFLDDLRELVFSGAMQARVHVANAFAMSCIVSQYPWDLRGDARCLSEEALARWQKRCKVADWTFGCGVYGSRAEVRIRKRRLARTLSQYGTLRFLGGCGEEGWKGAVCRWAAGLALKAAGKPPEFLAALVDGVNLFRGVPTDFFASQVYFKSHREKPKGDIDPPRDGCGFIWVAPVAPLTSRHVGDVLETATTLYRKHGFDFFVELIVESARSMISLLGIFYDKQDEEETERARSLYEELCESMLRKGYPSYRATAASTARALDHSPQLKQLVNELKRVLDPKGILAPGKYGIGARP